MNIEYDESRRRFVNNYFVTLLSTKDYLNAVLVLNESLKDTQNKHRLLVAVTEDIFEDVKDILIQHDCLVEKIKKLSYFDEIIEKNKNLPVLNTASKISLFSLKNYDKLVYIDADTIVMKNIDDLFDYPDGAMLKSRDDMGYGITSLFVFYPRNHEETLYQKLIQETDHFDGDLLGSLWFITRSDEHYQIPYEYCYNYSNDMLYDENNLKKVYHFNNLNIKPWINIELYKNNIVIDTYKNILNRIDDVCTSKKCNFRWYSLFD